VVRDGTVEIAIGRLRGQVFRMDRSIDDADPDAHKTLTVLTGR
jgi:hypothetical protein